MKPLKKIKITHKRKYKKKIKKNKKKNNLKLRKIRFEKLQNSDKI